MGELHDYIHEQLGRGVHELRVVEKLVRAGHVRDEVYEVVMEAKRLRFHRKMVFVGVLSMIVFLGVVLFLVVSGLQASSSSVIVSEEASVVEEEEEVVVVSSRVLREDVLVSEMGFSKQFLVYFVGDTVTFRVRSLDASYVVSSSFGSFSVPSSGELVEFSFVASEPGEVVFSLEGASQTKELLVVIS
ncbi:MAG: hypothetical protein ACMXYD_01025 [Candidatus Woesearchaeota archaeon]